MPELPDLEVFSKNLKKRLLNKELANIVVDNARKVSVPEVELKTKIVGSTLKDITRYGKELQFVFANNNILNVHLMLKGEMKILKASEIDKIKYKIISLFFDEEENLIIFDPRSLCKVGLNPKFGYVPDALSKEFCPQYFLDATKNSPRKNVKAFLINQDIIKGIGNAYADEILYDANISPLSTVGIIPEDILLNLYNSINKVLKESINKIIAITPNRISGEERSFLKVHNSQKSETDKGEAIIIEKIASKTTYYVSEQKVYK